MICIPQISLTVYVFALEFMMPFSLPTATTDGIFAVYMLSMFHQYHGVTIQREEEEDLCNLTTSSMQ